MMGGNSKIGQWRKRWCKSGIESWRQASLWTGPPRPLSLVTMSVTLMAASCDSIGSCSLDVDAESLADTLVDSAQVGSSRNHRNAGEHQANAASLSEQTLHSLLLSASSNSGGQNQDSFDKSLSDLNTPSPSAAKKPSYLNLACSISGYGGITTYDSKLREGFRSRDHSPGKLMNIQNGSREASPARGLAACPSNFLTAPNTGRLCWTPSPVSGQLTGRADMKHIPASGQRFNGTNGTDQTDATGNFNIKRISDQRNRWLESTLSPHEKDKDCHKVVSVFETKSDRHGLTSETSVETRYEVNSRSRSTVISSTTVVTSSSVPVEYSSSLRTERVVPPSFEGNSSDRNGHLSGKQGYTNGGSTHHTPVSNKSFIQQRVERLYGPGALAQGFFHRSPKCNLTQNLNSLVSIPTSHGSNGFTNQVTNQEKPCPFMKEGSPELPVLRHLRPEFRDQLTVAPRRSLGSRFSNGSSPSNSVASPSTVAKEEPVTISPLLQTSTESIADLQPAAPEVVLPQQSPTSAPMTEVLESIVDKHKSETKVSPPQESVLPSNSSEKVSSASLPPVTVEVTVEEVTEENAGHKFLRIQRNAIEKLLELAEKAEAEIGESGSNGKPILSEEALGHLRVAAGQARLLVTQKMVQFEGLCRKCINQRLDEPFPTTAEDLQGFWDMLLLQVDQVHSTFENLEKLKEVGWCEDKLQSQDKCKSADSSGSRIPSSASKRTPRASKGASPSSTKSAETAALRKQREEDRRKLMEQRRRELKEKQQAGKESTSNETVEIFGTQSS